MRNLLLTLVLLSSLSLIGQDVHDHRNCATEMSESQLSWLRSFQNNPELYPISYNRSLLYVPIQVHIVGNDEGNGYYSVSDLFATLCRLNNDFADANLYFYVEDDIYYINNSEYYDHDYNSGYEMMYKNNVNDRINIYFVNTPMEGNCGYFSPQGDAVAISKSCQGDDGTTLTHELGHFLSLPHTFYGWEGRTYESDPIRANRQERVNGSNCRTTGDGFCDTPPDYISDRWQCPYNKTYTDPNGDELNIDGTLFMSYANDECTNRFSQEQMDAMNAEIQYNRDELLRNSDPEIVTSLDEPTLIRPLEGSYNTPVNYSSFVWEKVEGATGYHVMVTRFNTFSNTVIDTIVNENYLEIVNLLDIDREYKWKVNPIAPGYTCSDFNSDGVNFIVTPYTENVDSSWKNTWDNVSELELNDFVLYPNAIQSGETISIELNELSRADRVQFINMNGQVVSERLIGSSSIEQINFEGNSGVYEVQLFNGSEQLNRARLIVF